MLRALTGRNRAAALWLRLSGNDSSPIALAYCIARFECFLQFPVFSIRFKLLFAHHITDWLIDVLSRGLRLPQPACGNLNCKLGEVFPTLLEILLVEQTSILFKADQGMVKDRVVPDHGRQDPDVQVLVGADLADYQRRNEEIPQQVMIPPQIARAFNKCLVNAEYVPPITRAVGRDQQSVNGRQLNMSLFEQIILALNNAAVLLIMQRYSSGGPTSIGQMSHAMHR